MKRFILLGSLLVAGLGFTSCSDDDNEEMGIHDTEIEGTYRLIAFNTATPTDFNWDGTPSTNQVDESDCYDNASITFNSFDVFSYVRNGISIHEPTQTAMCDDVTITGTYTKISGNEHDGVFRLTYLNGEGEQQTIDITKENNVLTYTDPYGPYPNRTSETVFTSTAGEIEHVFLKQ